MSCRPRGLALGAAARHSTGHSLGAALSYSASRSRGTATGTSRARTPRAQPRGGRCGQSTTGGGRCQAGRAGRLAPQGAISVSSPVETLNYVVRRNERLTITENPGGEEAPVRLHSRGSASLLVPTRPGPSARGVATPDGRGTRGIRGRRLPTDHSPVQRMGLVGLVGLSPAVPSIRARAYVRVRGMKPHQPHQPHLRACNEGRGRATLPSRAADGLAMGRPGGLVRGSPLGGTPSARHITSGRRASP